MKMITMMVMAVTVVIMVITSKPKLRPLNEFLQGMGQFSRENFLPLRNTISIENI